MQEEPGALGLRRRQTSACFRHRRGACDWMWATSETIALAGWRTMVGRACRENQKDVGQYRGTMIRRRTGDLQLQD